MKITFNQFYPTDGYAQGQINQSVSPRVSARVRRNNNAIAFTIGLADILLDW